MASGSPKELGKDELSGHASNQRETASNATSSPSMNTNLPESNLKRHYDILFNLNTKQIEERKRLNQELEGKKDWEGVADSIASDLEKNEETLARTEEQLETSQQQLEISQQELEAARNVLQETQEQDRRYRGEQERSYKRETKRLERENAQLRSEVSNLRAKLATIESNASLKSDEPEMEEGGLAATSSQQAIADEPTAAVPLLTEDMFSQFMAK